jgi:lipoprotein-anchoring transpeptidase ErfK/SrfK
MERSFRLSGKILGSALRPFAHALLSALFFFALSLRMSPLLLAQSPVGVAVDGSPASASQAIDASATLATGHDSDTDEAPGAARLAIKPPLPFTKPVIGPLIKRTFHDDVDSRTTAFLPQSLAHLTPVKLPNEGRWIRVDLSEQLVVAYEGKKAVRAFVVSSGLPGTPTVTGEFRIRTKVSEQVMSGGVGRNYYHLPGVKWVQYFYEDYGFHGTYWHNNFGHPMSHGCVNMTNADAKWLFDWAGPEWDGKTTWYKSSKENPGTLVIITE